VSGKTLRLAARVGAGALIGAVPGAILVLLTVPVSGEAELTLGVAGIGLAVVGAITGVIVLAEPAKGQRG
jgi:hypothetical protein